MKLGGDDVNVIPSHGLLMEWFIGVDPYDIEPTWLLEFRMFNA